MRIRPRWPRVYPRERGGTAHSPSPSFSTMGLSPRTRGNRRRRGAGAFPRRSIPANAGEPLRLPHFRRRGRVYPRERGGTARQSVTGALSWGLSPRTRGNPRAVNGGGGWPGSIPANAGEPLTRCSTTSTGGVYPRERGGTHARASAPARHQGLSPRTRGNRSSSKVRTSRLGSIPANAGEPSHGLLAKRLARVYPRERGGTFVEIAQEHRRKGLSPRTRGNRAGRRQSPPVQRSIPANAGEPLAAVE